MSQRKYVKPSSTNTAQTSDPIRVLQLRLYVRYTFRGIDPLIRYAITCTCAFALAEEVRRPPAKQDVSPAHPPLWPAYLVANPSRVPKSCMHNETEPRHEESSP